MKKITLIELKKQLAEERKEQPSRSGQHFSIDFKQKLTNYIMESGKSQKYIAKEIGLDQARISRIIKSMRKTMQNNKVAALHGDRPRMDIATQCQAVKEYIEKKRTKESLAEEYHVSPQTITNWVNKYRTRYDYLIETLEPGVFQLKDDSKLIYGSENINAMVKFKEKQLQEMSLLHEMMHKYGISKSAITKIEKEKGKTAEEVNVLKRALNIIDAA